MTDYLVTGRYPFRRVPRGGVVTCDLTPEQERRHIELGQITLEVQAVADVTRTPPTTKQTKEVTPDGNN